MKVKVKLDKDALLAGLIAHGEKIGFGVFILLFLLLCIGALRQKPYDKTPQKFKDEAVRVDTILANSAWNPAEPGVEPPIKPEVHPIPSGPYENRLALNMPPSESGNQRRGEPGFLPLHELRVGTEYGAVALTNKPPAGAAPQNAPAAPPAQPGVRPAAITSIAGKQWAVITGVIPAPQQAQEYRTVFASAPAGTRDLPHWDSFEIERQEGEGPWTPLDLKAMAAEEAMHAVAKDKESVDPAFLKIHNLCRRLPIMMDKDHDTSVVHPKIAQLSAELSLHKTQPGPQNGANLVPRPSGGKSTDLESQSAVDQMFRCFDYTVQAGKSYRYRVKLVLLNPNFGLQRYQVINGDFLKGANRVTKWSEPSPAVTIPRASSLLAGAVERARSATQESKFDVVLRVWDPVRAVDALMFDRIMRGQVANFNKATPVKNQATGKAEEMQINFQTNLVLLDLTGGDSLPLFRGRAPGRMLLLSPNGELDVKGELADLETYNNELTRIHDLTNEANPPEDPPPPTRPPADESGKKGRGGKKQ